MIKFIVGLLVGGFIGTMWMAMACIVDDIDEFDQFMQEQEEETEEPRCSFCGGKLSEIIVDINGKEYRHCYGCHFDRNVDGGDLDA